MVSSTRYADKFSCVICTGQDAVETPTEPLRTTSFEHFLGCVIHVSWLAFVGGIHSVYNVSSGIVINVFELCLHLANFLDTLVPFKRILHGFFRIKILDLGITRLGITRLVSCRGVVCVCPQGCLFSTQRALFIIYGQPLRVSRPTESEYEFIVGQCRALFASWLCSYTK
jgi:hypothetical protein